MIPALLGGAALLIALFGLIAGGVATRRILHTKRDLDNHVDKMERFLRALGFSPEDFREKNAIMHGMLLSSLDGHLIPYEWIKAGENAAASVVLVHGLGMSRVGTYPIADMFLSAGYNVLLYDQRGSGENSADTVCYGHLEKYDLADCVRQMKELAGQNHPIGLWGVSMGAATIGQYLGMEESQLHNIVFAVMDSPFSNVCDLFRRALAGERVPLPAGFMVFWSNIAMKLRYGMDYLDLDVRVPMAKGRIPTLLVAAEKDETTPVQMAIQLWRALPHDKKRLEIFQDSEHGLLFWQEKLKYRRVVYSFMNAVGL